MVFASIIHNLVTGGPVILTINAHSASSRPSHRTLCLNGNLHLSSCQRNEQSTIGDPTFSWKANDIFVVPSWATRRHKAHEDVVLFGFSDRIAQESLGIWREHRNLP